MSEVDTQDWYTMQRIKHSLSFMQEKSNPIYDRSIKKYKEILDLFKTKVTVK